MVNAISVKKKPTKRYKAGDEAAKNIEFSIESTPFSESKAAFLQTL